MFRLFVINLRKITEITRDRYVPIVHVCVAAVFRGTDSIDVTATDVIVDASTCAGHIPRDSISTNHEAPFSLFTVISS